MEIDSVRRNIFEHKQMGICCARVKVRLQPVGMAFAIFNPVTRQNFGKWCGTRSRQWAPHVYRCTAPLFWRLVLTRKPRDSRLVPVGSHGLVAQEPRRRRHAAARAVHFSGPSYANSPSATVAGRFIACILSNRGWSAAGTRRTAASRVACEDYGGAFGGTQRQGLAARQSSGRLCEREFLQQGVAAASESWMSQPRSSLASPTSARA